jgi:hypothetical protein
VVKVGQLALEEFVEGGGFVFALLGEVGFFAVAEGVEAGGFFDDDEVFVEVADGDVVVGGEGCSGVDEEVEDVAGFYFAGVVEDEVTIEVDPAGGDESADVGPGVIGAEDVAEGGGEGLPVVFGAEGEGEVAVEGHGSGSVTGHGSFVIRGCR